MTPGLDRGGPGAAGLAGTLGDGAGRPVTPKAPPAPPRAPWPSALTAARFFGALRSACADPAAHPALSAPQTR